MGNRIFCLAPITLLLMFNFPVEAQPPAKVHRIGFLAGGSLATYTALIEAFRQNLRELGYIEGRNIAIEYRASEGGENRLPELAVELVRLQVHLIVAWTTPAARAAKNATTTIPIVMVGVGDPVETGLVASLARPGANLTGLTSLSPELSGKRLELLKEVVPSATRVAVFWNPGNPSNSLQLKEVQAAAQTLALRIQSLEASRPDNIERAFAAMVREGAGALLVLADSFFLTHRVRLADLAAKNRVPAMYANRQNVEDGGLMSYAPDVSYMWRRLAYYVDKILKGTKPADLPVEQPMKFEFVINLKTAKQIGLTIPPNVLARADKVIR
jgi:putative tryptophan/tyrosine transport system substrate-binding protein